MATTRAERQSLQVTAYEFIKKKISTCEYAPNQLLSESMLQAELGMSRTPVREAITRLSQEGLITVYPKRGILVSSIGLNDINMIYEVRLMIEPFALRNYGNRLDINEMRRFAAFYEVCLQSDEKVPLYDEDDRFHSAILSVMPNIYLKDTYSRIQTQNNRLRILTGKTSRQRLHDTFSEHIAIAKACVAQDWDEAAEAMTRHILASRDAALTMLLENANSDLAPLLQ